MLFIDSDTSSLDHSSSLSLGASARAGAPTSMSPSRFENCSNRDNMYIRYYPWQFGREYHYRASINVGQGRTIYDAERVMAMPCSRKLKFQGRVWAEHAAGHGTPEDFFLWCHDTEYLFQEALRIKLRGVKMMRTFRETGKVNYDYQSNWNYTELRSISVPEHMIPSVFFWTTLLRPDSLRSNHYSYARQDFGSVFSPRFRMRIADWIMRDVDFANGRLRTRAIFTWVYGEDPQEVFREHGVKPPVACFVRKVAPQPCVGDDRIHQWLSSVERAIRGDGNQTVEQQGGTREKEMGWYTVKEVDFLETERWRWRNLNQSLLAQSNLGAPAMTQNPPKEPGGVSLAMFNKQMEQSEERFKEMIDIMISAVLRKR